MKRIIRIFIIAVMVAAFGATASAQQSSQQHPNRQQRISREQLAEVEARHIARELAFSDVVTEKFVTTFCDYQKEIWALGPRKQVKRQGSSEQEDGERIKQRFAMSEKILDIRQKYYKKYSQFLTQQQIQRVYELERQMMKRFAQKKPRKGMGKDGKPRARRIQNQQG